MYIRQLRLTVLFLTIIFSSAGMSVFGQACPTIQLEGDDGAIVYGLEGQISVKVPVDFLTNTTSYAWTVAGGLPHSGEKSNTIYFQAPREASGKEFRVAIKVSGLKHGCQASAATTIRVVTSIDYFPIDEFSIYSDEELLARVANLFIHVEKSPGDVALVEIQFKKGLSYKSRVRRIDPILKTLKLQNRDIDRVSFLISSNHESTLTRFWILPPDLLPKFAKDRGTVASARNIKAQLPDLLKSN